MMIPVAVTGLGVVAPNGTGATSFWSSLEAGASRTALPTTAPELKSRVAEVLDEAFLADLPVPTSALDRSAVLAVAAAGEALAQAGLRDAGSADFQRIGVVLGNGAGGQVSMDHEFRRIYKDGAKRTHPLTIARSMVSSSASWVSMAYGLRGPTFVVASACASGTHAIGIAAGMIASGMADVVVAGGTEAPLCFGTILAWESMRILSPDYCRPFSADRRGLILAEGAGVIVLERADHARSRGATVLGHVLGYDSCADAHDIVAPTTDGMIRAMGGALKSADLQPGDIDYINAHGTGTMSNDKTEAEAIVALFGADKAPPTSSTKAVTGHGLGAAGGLEAVATLLAIRHGVIPPTANHTTADPECPIDCVPNAARPATIRTALSNSFAFGGLNATLVFGAA